MSGEPRLHGGQGNEKLRKKGESSKDFRACSTDMKARGTFTGAWEMAQPLLQASPALQAIGLSPHCATKRTQDGFGRGHQEASGQQEPGAIKLSSNHSITSSFVSQCPFDP